MIMTRVLVLASALLASAGVFATAAPRKTLAEGGKAWADSDSSGDEGEFDLTGLQKLGWAVQEEALPSPVAAPTRQRQAQKQQRSGGAPEWGARLRHEAQPAPTARPPIRDGRAAGPPRRQGPQCFGCGEYGHKSADCPKKTPVETRTPTEVPIVARVEAPIVAQEAVAPTQRRQEGRKGKGKGNKGDRRPRTETAAAPVVAVVEAPPQEPVPQWKRFIDLLNKAEDETLEQGRGRSHSQSRPSRRKLEFFVSSNGFQVEFLFVFVQPEVRRLFPSYLRGDEYELKGLWDVFFLGSYSGRVRNKRFGFSLSSRVRASVVVRPSQCIPETRSGVVNIFSRSSQGYEKSGGCVGFRQGSARVPSPEAPTIDKVVGFVTLLIPSM